MSEESKNNKNSENSKGFVLPGDLLDTKSKPGKGIFRKDGRVYSSVVGYSNDKSGYVNVNAIKGRYNPKVGDKIVAVCAETGPSVWRMNIGSAHLIRHCTTVNLDGKFPLEILQLPSNR